MLVQSILYRRENNYHLVIIPLVSFRNVYIFLNLRFLSFTGEKLFCWAFCWMCTLEGCSDAYRQCMLLDQLKVSFKAHRPTCYKNRWFGCWIRLHRKAIAVVLFCACNRRLPAWQKPNQYSWHPLGKWGLMDMFGVCAISFHGLYGECAVQMCEHSLSCMLQKELN